MVTRRQFVVGGSASVVGTAVFQMPSACAQPPGGVRVRKDVSTLNATSPEITAMKAGVQAMRSLPPADRRSLIAQSRIHGDIAGNFRFCQHGNWWFTPWHRAYLFYFEEIIRKLSGAEDFALPYWDWSKDFQLPALFWGMGNPLDNPRRSGQPSSGRGIGSTDKISVADQTQYVNRTVLSRILQTSDFEIFGGSEVANLGDRAGQGRLESTPHNFIHRWVRGDMVTAGSSFDPIFWLHHCNVDRLWGEWVRLHPNGMPNSNVWLDTPFSNHFCDRQGNLISATSNATPIITRKLLDTTALGYRYDTRPTPPPFNLVATNNVLTGPVASLSGANVEDRAINFQMTAQPSFMTAIQTTINQPRDTEVARAVRLTLKGVKVPSNPNVGLEIHVNCLKALDARPNDPSHVASVTFFHDHPGEGEHEGGLTFLADLSPTLTTLYSDRPFPADEPLKVTLIARPLFGNEGTPEIKEISPTQVSISVVTPRS